MKARGFLSAIAVVAGAILSMAPTQASAKRWYAFDSPSRFVLIGLHAENGYGADIIAFGSKRVFLSLGNLEGGQVSYSVRGRVTDSGVHARLGNLGRIDLRLQPPLPAPKETDEPGCKGRQPIELKKARFVGTVRFRGEGGYTRIHATSAHGLFQRDYRILCRHRPPGHNPHFRLPRARSLIAKSSLGRKHPLFAALTEERRKGTGPYPFLEEARYFAAVSERREDMKVMYYSYAYAPLETFAFEQADGTASATVAPPAPFSGTATYQRNSSGEVGWSGDLSVNLAVIGKVPLTGPSYTARLCHSYACVCPGPLCSSRPPR